MAQQLGLDLTPRTWGGKREGAGRKTNKSKGLPGHDSPHAERPRHVARNPQHVVLRVVKGVGSMRSEPAYKAITASLKRIAERTDFRVVHMSIQRNHLHFLIEAADNDALESGMRALAISLAKRINRALERSGQLFEFRYHATALTTPRQARNAIAYVLNNWRRHREDERSGLAARFEILDRYSSAIRFTGWADWRLLPGVWPKDYVALPVAAPQTWLLARGWEKANRPIRTTDTPGPIA